MTVRYFRYDDAGAPTLTGQVGSLTTLLRKCLVGTGGVAYGTQPSAGWSESFAGASANIAVFRNSQAAGGTGCSVWVDDSGALVSGAREATVRAYATMTDIATGTTPVGDVYFRKSSALSTTARNWLLVADERTFWLYGWANGDTGSNGAPMSLLCAGDYEGAVDSSAFSYMVAGRSNSNANTGQHSFLRSDSGQTATDQTSLRLAPISGIGSALSGRVTTPLVGDTAPGAVGNSRFGPGPHATSGKYHLVDRIPVIAGTVFYGTLRGIAFPVVRLNQIAPGAVIPGNTRYIVAIGDVAASTVEGTMFGVALDTTGPWS